MYLHYVHVYFLVQCSCIENLLHASFLLSFSPFLWTENVTMTSGEEKDELGDTEHCDEHDPVVI